MDAHYYNGDFDQDWPSADDRCQSCGVSASQPCAEECRCESCIDQRPSAQGDGDPGLTDIISSLAYASYRAQRGLFPGRQPVEWAPIFPNWRDLEARYVEESR